MIVLGTFSLDVYTKPYDVELTWPTFLLRYRINADEYYGFKGERHRELMMKKKTTTLCGLMHTHIEYNASNTQLDWHNLVIFVINGCDMNIVLQHLD